MSGHLEQGGRSHPAAHAHRYHRVPRLAPLRPLQVYQATFERRWGIASFSALVRDKVGDKVRDNVGDPEQGVPAPDLPDPPRALDADRVHAERSRDEWRRAAGEGAEGTDRMIARVRGVIAASSAGAVSLKLSASLQATITGVPSQASVMSGYDTQNGAGTITSSSAARRRGCR